MGYLNFLSKCFIILFSEAAWIYYVIAIFTSIKWNDHFFFSPWWIIISAVAGFVINSVAVGRVHAVFVFLANIFAVGFILFQNWFEVVPDGAWGFGISLSIGISILYIRSANFILKAPTREQMLRHFEGNIILYVTFLWILMANSWVDEFFHMIFLGAIFISLLGMILTLKSQETSQDDQIEIQKVGQSGWFSIVIGTMLGIISLICLLFFLPFVRDGLIAIAMQSFDFIKMVGLSLTSFLKWLLSLLPDSNIEGTIPGIEPNQSMIRQGNVEEELFELPIIWIFGGIALIIIVICIFVISRLLKKFQLNKAAKVQRIAVIREPWWMSVKERIKTLYLSVYHWWRMRFRYNYHYPVYWYFHKVQVWGKRNGLTRLKQETSKEYITRLSASIPEHAEHFHYEDQSYYLSHLLFSLHADFQAAYYGQVVSNNESEHKILVRQIKKLRLKRESSTKFKFLRRFPY